MYRIRSNFDLDQYPAAEEIFGGIYREFGDFSVSSTNRKFAKVADIEEYIKTENIDIVFFEDAILGVDDYEYGVAVRGSVATDEDGYKVIATPGWGTVYWSWLCFAEEIREHKFNDGIVILGVYHG